LYGFHYGSPVGGGPQEESRTNKNPYVMNGSI
jgi:hypothetical protein